MPNARYPAYDSNRRMSENTEHFKQKGRVKFKTMHEPHIK